jgi:hypothetical protein
MKTFKNFVIEKKKMKGKDPCWDSHQMVGTKMKNGREVPNCVPKEETEAQYQDAAKARIAKEKEADKIKHDKMLDRARTNDTRMINRKTK